MIIINKKCLSIGTSIMSFQFTYNREYTFVHLEYRGFNGGIYQHRWSWGFGQKLHYYKTVLPF